MPTKLFRRHRGGLSESLSTTIEVKNLKELKKYIKSELGFSRNVKIKEDPVKDRRLPPEWGGLSYYVVADVGDYKELCIGMTNFYK